MSQLFGQFVRDAAYCVSSGVVYIMNNHHAIYRLEPQRRRGSEWMPNAKSGVYFGGIHNTQALLGATVTKVTPLEQGESDAIAYREFEIETDKGLCIVLLLENKPKHYTKQPLELAFHLHKGLPPESASRLKDFGHSLQTMGVL